MIVALDGPAGVGKSTVARELARRLDFQLIETGAIYRAVGLLAREQGIALDDAEALEAIARTLPLRYRFEGDRNHVYLGDRDVTDALRTPQASSDASVVSVIPAVRVALLDLQRSLAESRDSIMEGRDIGTVVCPNAEVKVFVSASAEVRAQRRFDELQAEGIETTFDAVLEDQRIRDDRDTNRAVAPLRPADDAHMLDTSDLSIEAVIEQVIAWVSLAR